MFRRYKNWKWNVMEIFYASCVFLTLLSLCIVAVHAILPEEAPQEQEPVQEETVQEETLPANEISLAFTGDLMMEYYFYKWLPDDYSFGSYLDEVRDLLEADVTIANLETPIGGAELGISGSDYTFNAPDEVAVAISQTPINMVTLANNHTYDVGQTGIDNTISILDELGIAHTGAYADEQSSEQITYIQVRDIRLAVLAYTYGTNKLQETSYGVNTFLTNGVFTAEKQEEIAAQIQEARANADFVIVAAHWGSEFTYNLLQSQTTFANFLVEQGVDLVIGNHPHNIQYAEMVENPYGKNTCIVYALGNFISAGADVPRASVYFSNMYSIGLIGRMNLIKDETTGEVTMNDVELVPVVNHFEEDFTNFQLIPLEDYTEEMADRHLQHYYSGSFTAAWLKEQMHEVLDSSGLLALD